MKPLIHHFTVTKLIVAACLLLVCFVGTGLAQSAEDDYKLRIDIVGVPGDGAGGSIEGVQYSGGVAAEMGAITGAQAGKAKFSPIVITKVIDSATPKLQTICAAGQRLSHVQISVIRSNRSLRNGEQVFLKILLDDVQVSSVNTRLPKSNDPRSLTVAGEPYEEVSFTYGRITWIYILPNGSTIQEAWDLRTNR